MILTGPYKVQDYAFDVKVALTNKCGNGPMRAPMAITSWVMEGTIDAIARALELDPVDVRRVNMVARDELPYTMPTGEVLEDITPRETLEAALRGIDYAGFRARQRTARDGGRCLGIGICNVVESTTYGSRFYKSAGIPGSGHEAAWIRIEPSGAVNASVGLSSTGQGYETALAQVVAEGLGVPPQDVNVQLGHTDIAPYGMGSRGSRGGTAGGGTLYLCALEARAKMRAIAARLLEAADADIEVADGVFTVAGTDRTKTFAEVARTAYLYPLALPEGMPPGLDFGKTYDPPPMTYSNATHACIDEDDVETGALAIERYVLAEDCGTVMSPVVVEGQQHGAVAMGLGNALLERIVYDESGQNLTGTLADYLVPTACDLPEFEVIPMHTPNRRSPAGIKGMAEGGVMGGIGAVANAVNDALAPFGVVADRLPLAPEYLRALLRGKA
jgi:carbon-monoxide dehydrogenase large subunit